MPPKAAPPPRGLWGPGGQQGGGVNHLAASTGGTVNSTYAGAFDHVSNLAHALLTRTTAGSVIPVNINIPAGPANLQQNYTVWYILDVAVADELRRILAFASVRSCFVSLFFLVFADSVRTARHSPCS